MAIVPPKFVNLTDGPVSVFNEKKRPVTVHPYSWMKKGDESNGTFVVEGEHYRQFGTGGPLSPFPADEKTLQTQVSKTPEVVLKAARVAARLSHQQVVAQQAAAPGTVDRAVPGAAATPSPVVDGPAEKKEEAAPVTSRRRRLLSR